MRGFGNHIFLSAKQYLNLALLAEEHGRLEDTSMAVVTNYAFSVELMLKSLDVATDTPEVNTSPNLLARDAKMVNLVTGHDLSKIYNELPEDTRNTLSRGFTQITSLKISDQLVKFKDVYMLSRYSHDVHALKKNNQNEVDNTRVLGAVAITELRDLAKSIRDTISSVYTVHPINSNG